MNIKVEMNQELKSFYETHEDYKTCIPVFLYDDIKSENNEFFDYIGNTLSVTENDEYVEIEILDTFKAIFKDYISNDKIFKFRNYLKKSGRKKINIKAITLVVE